MAAPTVTQVSSLLAGVGGPGAGGALSFQTFKVVPATATDIDVSLTGVLLTHVLGMTWIVTDTTNTALADSEHLWIDQALDATKNCIVVASNALVVTRVGTGTSPVLISKVYTITLLGY